MFTSIAFPSQLPLATRRRLTIRAAVSEADKKILYEVLRVKRNASQVEIKTAYRTLAKLYHPDAKSRFMDSEVAKSTDGRDFIEIHQAYATLSDPDARAQYDSNLSLIVPPQQRRWNEESGLRSPGGAGFSPRSPGAGESSPTRRWETDQCW